MSEDNSWIACGKSRWGRLAVPEILGSCIAGLDGTREFDFTEDNGDDGTRIGDVPFKEEFRAEERCGY